MRSSAISRNSALTKSGTALSSPPNCSAAQEPRQGISWPRLIRPAVSAATEFVIWTGMKL
ncbi:MAG TPA: hypothetical protein VFZ95_09470 [Steroidobacteraceae bacterium]